MFNQVFITGILEDLPNDTQCYLSDPIIYLKVKKPYDEYDPHHNYVHIPVVLWPGLAKKILCGAKAGSILEIKGRLLNRLDDQSRIYLRAESCQILDYELELLASSTKNHKT